MTWTRGSFSWGRVLLTTACVALLAWGGYVGARQLGARRHWQIAQLALERHDLDLAQQHLEKCLQVRGDDPDVLLLAAQTARRRDDYDRADAYLSLYEPIERRGSAGSLERALLIAQQGDPDRVQKQLQAILQSRPDQTATILEAMGKGSLNCFSNRDALECFNGLVKNRPDYAMAFLMRGKAHERLERYDNALHDYRRAVQLSASLDDARLHLARGLYRAGRSWEAAPHFECLRQRQPRNAEVLLGLARCRADLGELPATRECLSSLLAEHPDHAGALLERGRLDYQAGQPADAERFLRRAADLAACDADSRRLLLWCLRKQGKDSDLPKYQAQLDAIENMQRQLEVLLQQARTGGRDAPLLWQIGESLRRLDRDPEALSYYFAALAEDAKHAPSRAALADYFERTRQSYRAARMRRADGAPSGEQTR